jgi:hypothetical protein
MTLVPQEPWTSNGKSVGLTVALSEEAANKEPNGWEIIDNLAWDDWLDEVGSGY